MINRRTLLVASAAAGALQSRPGHAQGKALRIGVLNDMTGVFADDQGPGSTVATQMAVEDAGKTAGRPVEVVAADHQNKPDLGLAIARRWFDQEGVDVILDVPNSSIALAVAALATERNKVFIGSGAGLADLTGAKCSPNIVHWTYDTWQLGHSLGRAITEAGGKKWFLLAADYVFGADLDRNVSEAVKTAGGTIVGGVKAPFPTSDFSSFLLQAQSSGADVLGLDNAGDDTRTSLKQASEFGLMRAMKVASPIFNVNIANGVGLEVTQGVLGVTPFYWDMNDATRSFSKRFQARHPHGHMPDDMQAGCYAACVHLFKAVAKAGDPADGAKVVAAMKAIPTDDPLFGHGTIRADGRKLHPIFLVQTKTPAESKYPWDYFKIISTIPADQAFRSLTAGGCPMVRS